MPASVLPPGPDRGRLTQTVTFARDPVRVLLSARKAYGSVFTLRFAGVGPVVAVALPGELPRLLSSDPGDAHAGQARRSVLPYASPRSVFGGDEEEYRTARGRVAAHFARDAVAAHAPTIAHIAERHVACWPQGRPFPLLGRVRPLVAEVFLRCLLGIQDDDRVREGVRLIRRLAGIPVNPPALPDAGLLGAAARTLVGRRLSPLAGFLVAEVNRRRTHPPSGEPGGTGILDALAHGEPPPAPERIVDELTVLVAAAQEPMAIAVTHVLARLARRPDLARRVMAEGVEGELFAAVVRETLRLRPPALAALRTLTQPATFGGHLLGPGVTVMAPIPLVHRDPVAFPDPEAFAPERFLTASPSPHHVPFGGGQRSCIAEALAWTELGAVVPVVLRSVRLRPVAPRPERLVQRTTVLAPVHGELVIAANVTP